jgi:hypothetical protein
LWSAPAGDTPFPDNQSLAFFSSSYTLTGIKLDRPSRLLKNAHLRRCPRPSSLRRTAKYASLLRILSALHLGLFQKPAQSDFFSKLIVTIQVPNRASLTFVFF